MKGNIYVVFRVKVSFNIVLLDGRLNHYVTGFNSPNKITTSGMVYWCWRQTPVIIYIFPAKHLTLSQVVTPQSTNTQVPIDDWVNWGSGHHMNKIKYKSSSLIIGISI